MSAQSLNLLKLNWTLLRATANLLLRVWNCSIDKRTSSWKSINWRWLCLLVMWASQVLPYHIETNLNISPVQYLLRQVPVQLQGAYQEELEWLRQADFPEQVHNEYTPWVNSTVVTRKPNGTIYSPLPGPPRPEQSNSMHPLQCENHRWCQWCLPF